MRRLTKLMRTELEASDRKNSSAAAISRTSAWSSAALNVRTTCIAGSQLDWPWASNVVLSSSEKAFTLVTESASINGWVITGSICAVCRRSISYLKRWPANGYRHQASGQALVASAESGCALCFCILEAFGNEQRFADVYRGAFDGMIWLRRKYGSRALVAYCERDIGALLKKDQQCLCKGRSKSKVRNSTVEFAVSLVTWWGRRRLVWTSLRPGRSRLQIVSKETLPLSLSKSAVLAFIGSALSNCLRQHGYCPASTQASLPHRLVDVSDFQKPKLWVNSAAKSSKGVYTALSYCWGRDDFLRLEPGNIEAWKNGIPLRRLPQTLVDAIEITRGLGIQFIWIDALCILQGPSIEARNDWARQSVLMDVIFGNAAVVLGAASSASATDGIIYEDALLQQNNTFIDTPASAKDATHTPPDPLYTRGWTFQERLLATRYVHLGRTHVFFECSTSKQFLHPNSGSAPCLPLCQKISLTPSYSDWHRLVEDFSSRTLSSPTDRLIALAGVAQQFRARLGFAADYVAGLWTANLPRDLLWVADTPAPNLAIAPSWSWASSAGKVSYSRLEGHASCGPPCASVVRTRVLGFPHAFGPRAQGRLRVRGYLRKVFVRCGSKPGAFHIMGFKHHNTLTATLDLAATSAIPAHAHDTTFRAGICKMDTPDCDKVLPCAGPRVARYGVVAWHDVFEAWALELHPGRGLLLALRERERVRERGGEAETRNVFGRVGYFEVFGGGMGWEGGPGCEKGPGWEKRSQAERMAVSDPLAVRALLERDPFGWMLRARAFGDRGLVDEWFGWRDRVVTLV
ncbi:uncharacterized protein K452DRAFT_250239 [Aplosporella prunicola CBS 121167]|uniref:Heterokaryon incompatibility domain-containing protein n=1 Tax=Aplosporella prunicola CBS 121167 TaxID=1176127 RepID=A0A6A6BBI0_9PEZI|nr:uncharacterized protein K452DRAFT_250239 [Aplosporella prunicola CBS 121167]KAF2141559.1 hypothetical protein K452DRAFT_250239 [Aplosporella prunicola CBS 121167]